MAATEADRDAVIADVRTFYSNDTDMYNELTQEDHALQAAYAASQAGSDEATIVAALLHDVSCVVARGASGRGVLGNRSAAAPRCAEAGCLTLLMMPAHCSVDGHWRCRWAGSCARQSQRAASTTSMRRDPTQSASHRSLASSPFAGTMGLAPRLSAHNTTSLAPVGRLVDKPLTLSSRRSAFHSIASSCLVHGSVLCPIAERHRIVATSYLCLGRRFVSPQPGCA